VYMLVCVCWYVYAGKCMLEMQRGGCVVTARAKQIVRVSLTILFAVQGPGTPFLEIAFAPTRVVFPWDNLETPHTHQ
jgi:hypothetical protein